MPFSSEVVKLPQTFLLDLNDERDFSCEFLLDRASMASLTGLGPRRYLSETRHMKIMPGNHSFKQ